MSITISLDDELVKEAKSRSKVVNRSVPQQITHWAKIGRIAEDNPDLSYKQITGILLGLQDVQDGNIKEYKRGIL